MDDITVTLSRGEWEDVLSNAEWTLSYWGQGSEAADKLRTAIEQGGE